ncbi:LysR substrate-binding domain-containing protein, partial [Pseudomonas aeruginosa]
RPAPWPSCCRTTGYPPARCDARSLTMMLTLVGAGYGIGFMTATKIPISQRPDVVIRPLAQDTAVITTYLLRPESSNSSVSLDRFIERLRGPPDD